MFDAPRNQDRHSERPNVRQRQQIGPRFRSRIRAARPQRKRLVGLERRIDISVHLIGRDQEEPWYSRRPRRVEQGRRATHVRLDRLSRGQNAPVHVRLRGKVHHGIDRFVSENGRHHSRVTDIPVHEAVARVAAHHREVLEVSSVSQLVERHDGHVRTVSQDVSHECGPDEARSAGDQPLHLN